VQGTPPVAGGGFEEGICFRSSPLGEVSWGAEWQSFYVPGAAEDGPCNSRGADGNESAMEAVGTGTPSWAGDAEEDAEDGESLSRRIREACIGQSRIETAPGRDFHRSFVGLPFWNDTSISPGLSETLME
jgi:hypothetical protein